MEGESSLASVVSPTERWERESASLNPKRIDAFVFCFDLETERMECLQEAGFANLLELCAVA